MSMSSSQIRLMNDVRQMRTEPPDGCSGAPLSDDNLYVWQCTIFGPSDTPWEGGIFTLKMTFPEQYPEKPPRLRFNTPMFHPNIYADGTLCLDILQDKWSPIYNVNSILTSVQSLLTDPNPHSPANPEAAHMYESDIKEYQRRVRRVAERSLEGDWE
eukprot:EC793431.1.p1 GENE.EC793431.1~~EC793431.1.p1  ORF type:complete len:157 (+),score=35.30 EC793431.1:78-548(+)